MQLDEIYQIFLKNSLICTDTRKITPGCLFFALKGEKFNGNTFAESALENGAAYAVIDEVVYKKSEKYILVNDVLKTLQDLSKLHRSQFKVPVIAIVGSNGKTTTKELITSVLSQKYKVLSTPGNFNNHIGLPLTLLMLEPKHEIAVIEMGANHIGENAFLCELAMPTHGLITNNGKDHLEGFGSIEGVAASNSELYYYLLKNNGIAFVNANDEWLMRMANRLINKITYAANFNTLNTNADFVAYAKQLQPQIQFTFEDEIINSVLSGDYNFDNIIAAVAIGKYFSVEPKLIKNGIEIYKPQNLRSQIIETAKNKIFLDAYNANPSSMQAGLRNFANMPHKNKLVILGDMFELGKYAETEHQAMVDLCKSLGLTKVILVGKEFSKTKTNYLNFVSTDQCKEYLAKSNVCNEFIFIKGSRGMKLESLTEVL
ncbi:MAG: UDP-N-acetylmuramoyl-tripeptide--D-alanyl-D-alanine ligase [Bacteroidia bacterium]